MALAPGDEQPPRPECSRSCRVGVPDEGRARVEELEAAVRVLLRLGPRLREITATSQPAALASARQAATKVVWSARRGGGAPGRWPRLRAGGCRRAVPHWARSPSPPIPRGQCGAGSSRPGRRPRRIGRCMAGGRTPLCLGRCSARGFRCPRRSSGHWIPRWGRMRSATTTRAFPAPDLDNQRIKRLLGTGGLIHPTSIRQKPGSGIR
jgi:hypothetical protein